jgi:hypothetical protein
MLAVESIYNEALVMQPLEKVHLIDKLILSLDIPNQTIEKQWNDEVEDRIKAYENDELNIVPMKKVFSKYGI